MEVAIFLRMHSDEHAKISEMCGVRAKPCKPEVPHKQHSGSTAVPHVWAILQPCTPSKILLLNGQLSLFRGMGNGISDVFNSPGQQEYMYTRYLSLGLFQPFEKIAALTVRIDDLT